MVTLNGGRDPGRLDVNAPCVTVTGTVYSKVGVGTEEDDGDLHFTLTLDKQYEKYSNSEDPICLPSHGLPNPCHNIIVEVICHKKPSTSYITQQGDYRKEVRSEFSGMPSQGAKLSVSGRWITDMDRGMPKPHAAWNENHPAFAIHS